MATEDNSGQETSATTAITDDVAMDCHFHAGVEHCVPVGSAEGSAAGTSATATTCDGTSRGYNVSLRIGMIFVVLVTSAIGVFTPILLGSLLRIQAVSFILMQLKQFGTGVLVSTAFVHLYTHAELLLTNSCITWPERYEGTTAAFVMLGIFLSFLVEYVGSRIIMRKSRGKPPLSAEPDKQGETAVLGPQDVERSTAGSTVTGRGRTHIGIPWKHGKQHQLAVFVMEAGIIFHSILIGLTLIVAGDNVFRSLVVVVIFHQMFEGIALGSRIAELPTSSIGKAALVPTSKKLLLAGAFTLITPIGMAIGIGVLNTFNGNDPATVMAIGILDAISAGILAWVALVEMWAGDWLQGPLATAPEVTVDLSAGSLVVGMTFMSVLGKWA